MQMFSLFEFTLRYLYFPLLFHSIQIHSQAMESLGDLQTDWLVTTLHERSLLVEKSGIFHSLSKKFKCLMAVKTFSLFHLQKIVSNLLVLMEIIS